MVLRKHELEAKLKDDIELVRSGVLRDENPLDLSDDFNELLGACRHGNLKRVQELISAGVNLNGKDRFDYTPLIIVSVETSILLGTKFIILSKQRANSDSRQVYAGIMSW